MTSSESISLTPPAKGVWKVFWDLQCPYSKKSWERLDEIRQRFSDRFDFDVHITSLLFHRQAFAAHCAASLVNTSKGPDAKRRFVDACFRNQDRYLDAAVGDSPPSKVDAIFASIAKEAGVLDDDQGDDNAATLTEEYFLSHLRDWKAATLPAWTEHKIALGYQVYGTAKFVINNKLVEDTESGWGPDEWEKKLEAL
jgi:protein-disulfide isomerase